MFIFTFYIINESFLFYVLTKIFYIFCRIFRYFFIKILNFLYYYFLSFFLNLILVIFFSSFYALIVLKPKDLSENLTKMAYSIPGLKQGKETTRYLEQIISRLAFMGGIFLAFLALFPFVLSNLFHFNVFKNLTSLVILVGVITDVSSQIRGYLVSQNYENF